MLSRQDRSFLKLAAKVAELSDMKTRHGCVIVRSGSVLSMAVNSFRNDYTTTEPNRYKDDCSIHAEVAAIKRCKDTRGAVLYVSRINRGGEFRLSKPCIRCQVAIEKAQLKRVAFSTSQGEQL